MDDFNAKAQTRAFFFNWNHLTEPHIKHVTFPIVLNRLGNLLYNAQYFKLLSIRSDLFVMYIYRCDACINFRKKNMIGSHKKSRSMRSFVKTEQKRKKRQTKEDDAKKKKKTYTHADANNKIGRTI